MLGRPTVQVLVGLVLGLWMVLFATFAWAQRTDSLVNIQLAGRWVTIHWPGQVSPTGTLLVLPGWNFSRTSWCANSNLCKLALAKGYVLVMPEMGKSIYATTYYPETRVDWRTAPTGTWLVDTLLPLLQRQYHVLLPTASNYLLGLSTGGRGVAWVAQHTGTLFKAGAAFSGDYDQRQDPADNLMRGVYGPMDQFRSRWAGPDNPSLQAANWQIPIYLAHGQEDKVVPWQQSQLFADSLRAHHPNLALTLQLVATAGHDYSFWNAMLPAALAFFAQHP